MAEGSEEVLFDVGGAGSGPMAGSGLPEAMVPAMNMVMKICLGGFLMYFSANELWVELRSYRHLSRGNLVGGR